MPADPRSSDPLSRDPRSNDPIILATTDAKLIRLHAIGLGQTLAIYAAMLHSGLLISGWIGLHLPFNALLYLYSFGFVLSIMAISWLARGMRFNRAKTLVSVIGQFIPLLNLLCLIYLSLQAIPLLRQAGYQIGLLGVKVKPMPHRR